MQSHHGVMLVSALAAATDHPMPLRCPPQVCNCDCLPIIPLEQWGRCQACTAGSAGDDEAMSDLSTRDSLDSQRSEMEAERLP